ncbi:3-hydroxyacyl-CoA dehydrogenase [Sulfolobus acidocaldarius SUSAZ]|nr:3-hydroxyacyl-CoA dehydrogenase [Sulfolobus acidocaldarius SUSAZ]
MKQVNVVSIVGAGIIGAGWSTLLAVHGYRNIFYTEKKETLDKGLLKIKSYLQVMHEYKLVDKSPEEYMQFITPTTDFNDVMKGDFIIEAVIEDYGVKKKVFGELDERLDKDVIIASSTSGLLISEIQKSMSRHPERAIIAHPWNPPHLLPLVEIVPGEKTSEEVIQSTRELMEDKLNRVVVVLKKEVPGFIGNRLAFALFREAVHLIDEGVATVEDIDKVVTAAIGLRWVFMGPFLTYHLGGGEGGLEYFFSRGFGYGANEWMYTLAKYDKFPYTGVIKAVNQMKEYQFIKGKSFQELSKWRDENLINVLRFLKEKGAKK